MMMRNDQRSFVLDGDRLPQGAKRSADGRLLFLHSLLRSRLGPARDPMSLENRRNGHPQVMAEEGPRARPVSSA